MATTRFVSAGRRVHPVVLLVSAVWSTPVHAQPNIDHSGIEGIEFTYELRQ